MWFRIRVFVLVMIASLLGSLFRLELSLPMPHFFDEIHPVWKLPRTTIYSDVSAMPSLVSSGPHPVEPGGMYRFHNVCITYNVDAAQQWGELNRRGLIYFVNSSREIRNEKRCVPCSGPIYESLEEVHPDEQEVNHKCGLMDLHFMFAGNISDWNDCMSQPKTKELLDLWAQNQLPSHADNVHYFQDPTLLLMFHWYNPGHALYDFFLSFLPHWHREVFAANDKSSFTNVLAQSYPDCLTSSTNWMCEILRAIMGGADTAALQLPPEPTPSTLYCFDTIYYTHIAWQRHLDHTDAFPKQIMDDARDLLFRNMNLHRPRIGPETNTVKGPEKRTVLLYAHKPSGNRVWKNMDELVRKAAPRFPSLDLKTVENFGELSVLQQARHFNEADVVVMVHGAQFANSLFSPEGTHFVELGCAVPSFLSSPNYLHHIGGTYRAVIQCPNDERGGTTDICVKCPGGERNPVYKNFTMSERGFMALLKEISSEKSVL